MRVTGIFHPSEYLYHKNPTNYFFQKLNELWKKVDIFGDGSCKVLCPFNGDYKDLAGTLNLTLTSGSVSYQKGIDNRLSLWFNNTQLSDSNFTINGWNAVTFSYWANVAPKGNSEMKILGFSGSGDLALEYYIPYSTANTFRVYSRNCISVSDFSNAFQTDTWEFWTISIDSTGTKVYKNGNLLGSGSQKLCSVSSPFSIGYVYNNNPFYFKNAIQQLRIFNRVLTQEEIQYLYTKKC